MIVTSISNDVIITNKYGHTNKLVNMFERLEYQG